MAEVTVVDVLVCVVVMVEVVVQQMGGAASPRAGSTGQVPEIASNAEHTEPAYMHGPAVPPLHPSQRHSAAVGAGGGGGGQVVLLKRATFASKMLFFCGLDLDR